MAYPTKEFVDALFDAPGDFSANRTGWPEPSVYIQWKGTDVCMDFHCDCGAFCHFDGDFAYVVQCPHCKTLWQMPSIVYPRKLTDSKEKSHWADSPKILDTDEDHVDEDGNPLPVSDK